MGRHAGEEVPREVGRVAVFEVGALVAAVEEIPVGCADVCAARPAEGDPGIGYAAALLADLFALVLGEAGKEVVEVFEGLARAAA